MRKPRKFLAGAAVGSIIAATMLMFGVAAPASAATNLGGLSVAQACAHQRGTSETVLVENNATGWRCHYFGGWNYINQSVNLSAECARVHGAGAYAAYLDYNNPYSWRCFK